MKHYQLRPFSDNLTRRRIITKLAAGGAAMASAVRSHAASPLAAQAATAPLKITLVRAYPVRLWTKTEQGKRPDFTSDFDPRRRRYFGPFAQLVGAIVVVIHTDQGITGYGLGGGGRVAAEIIHGHLRHLLLGTDPRNVELLWDQMYTSGQFYGRRGVFVMALSGIDNALWDIVGKHAGKPVHALIGGLAKKKVPAYFTSSDPEAGLRLGFRHFKIPVREGVDEGPAGMKRTVEMLTRARDRIGPTSSLMIDCLGRWETVDYAIEMARRLEQVRLRWIEEPLLPDDVMGYAQLVREVDSTRIALGEHEYTRFGFADLLRHKAVEILQPDITWSGGLTSLRRIATMAAEHSLPIIPHRGGSLYGLSLVFATPHCPLAESFGTGDNGTELMEAMSGRYRDGYYYPSEKPGFGTAVTEEMVKKHAV